MQVRTQRVTNNTNREIAEPRKEMNEVRKDDERSEKQPKNPIIPNSKNNGQTTSRIEIPRDINNDDGELNASDTDNQGNRLQDNPFRPSETNELRTPVPPISIQILDLDDTVILNEDRAEEDYHSGKQGPPFSFSALCDLPKSFV